MQFYIDRDGVRFGPYTQRQITDGLSDGTFVYSDRAWKSGRLGWASLRAVMENASNACPQCRGELLMQTESPQKSTGVIVVVIGLVFTPLCIGIPFLIWGLSLMSESRSQWHCRDCGRTFPA